MTFLTISGSDRSEGGLVQPGAMAESSSADYLIARLRNHVQRSGETNLDIWHNVLGVGDLFPTMPLWLRGGICLPVDLEGTYERTRSEQRLDGSSDRA